MTDTQQPDLTGEREREREAAGGIVPRAVVLEIDADDDALEAEPGADAEDDEAVEDADARPVDATV